MSSSSRDGTLALNGSLLGLTTLAVGLRFYARKKQAVPLKADDFLAAISLISYFGAAICVFILVHYKAFGYSEPDFEAAAASSNLNLSELSAKNQIALDILEATSLACTKLSALFFYRRIFCVDVSRNWFNIATIVSIVVVTLWYVVFQFLTGFQCGTHFSALWGSDYTKYCTISFPFLEGLAISDFLLDIWILLLPIPRIWELHTAVSRKLSIMGIFLLAFVGVGCSIARMVQYIEIEDEGMSYFLTNDEEVALTKAFFMAQLETGISLIAVNLPTLSMLSVSLTPQKIIRSIRSVISLRSLRSNGSRDGRSVGESLGPLGPAGKDSAGLSTRPSESSAGLPPSGDHAFRADLEAYKREVTATRDAEKDGEQVPPQSGVHVHNTTSIKHSTREVE